MTGYDDIMDELKQLDEVETAMFSQVYMDIWSQTVRYHDTYMDAGFSVENGDILEAGSLVAGAVQGNASGEEIVEYLEDEASERLEQGYRKILEEAYREFEKGF